MEMMKKPKVMHEPDCKCSMCHGGKMRMDDGGEVNSDPQELQKVSDSFKGAVHNYKDGGEVEGQDELHNMIGNEIMEGIHSKDHKKLMGGIEAMVLRCLNKKEE